MEPITIIVIIAVIIALIIIYAGMKKKTGSGTDNYRKQKEKNINKKENTETSTDPYMPYRKKALLTKTEYAFYIPLRAQCAKRKILVHPKIRLEDFIQVTDKKNLQKYRGYIKSRHVDFVLCDLRLNIIAAIELDDPSHNSWKAQKTDCFKNELFKTIDVRLYRVSVGQNYADNLQAVLDDCCPLSEENTKE